MPHPLIARACLGFAWVMAAGIAAPSTVGADEPTAGDGGGGADEAREESGRYQSVVYPRRQMEPGQALVVSGQALAERGANNLAEALDLLPALSLRPSGRGATRVDFRGVRQAAVLILLDGVPVNEPFFGDFDLASVPVTDIQSIRVSLQPASPLDGAGGDGGLVEVETRRATGPRRLELRVQGATTPGMSAAIGGRTPLSERWALRLSAGGGDSLTSYPISLRRASRAPLPSLFPDRRSDGRVALRLEYQAPIGRLTADAFYQHRRYSAAPGEATGSLITDIPAEDALRAAIGVEGERGGLRLSAGTYGSLLLRTTDFFRDGALHDRASHEETQAYRVGAAVAADRTLGRWVRLSARLSLDSEGATVTTTSALPSAGRQTVAQLGVGARFAWRWLRIDGAAGVASRLDALSAAWPEARLDVAVVPNHHFQLRITAARKGRSPSLRDRFDPNQGNPALAPEQADYLGVEVLAQPSALVEARVVAYARRADGQIRFDAASARFANLDELRASGVDASVELGRDRLIGGGAAYLFGDSWSPARGFDTLFNFPRHRADVWLSSTWRRRVGGRLRVRYTGDRIDDNQRLAPFVLVDASLFARLHTNLSASLRADNLLDERYALRANLTGPPRTLSLVIEGVWR